MRQTAHASYMLKNLTVTINLNKNTSAKVTEVLSVYISNQSVSQYTADRSALNLTLSEWQAQTGLQLEQHIINPNRASYDFKFFPGPVTTQYGQNIAYLILTYEVNNVTVSTQTAPREFHYVFNPKVFNFQHGVSGEILGNNTNLTMMVPPGALITSVYPLPDVPPYAFTSNFRNVTEVSWLSGEPLSKFSFVFVVRQSIQAEVVGFLNGLYTALGLWIYVLIAAAIVIFIVYSYYKATR